MNEPDLPFDASSPSQLEQRLHSLKPRQSILDIEAIARIADAKSANQIGIAIVPHSESWYSTKVLACTVAASWVFGVAVGASVVFFTLSNDQPLDRKSKVAESGFVEQEREATASTPTTPSPIESKIADGSVPAQLEFARWDLDLGTEPLQVGMSLRSRNRLVRTGTLSSSSVLSRNSERISNNANDLRDAAALVIDAPIRNPLPPTPATQSELLKSLLQDANRNIY